jgi:hypothetical protein
MWPFAVAIAASRILSFPLPGAWNPSIVPAPGVSLLDALIFFCAGYYGSQRTRQFSDGVVIAAATSLFGFIAFLVYAAITESRSSSGSVREAVHLSDIVRVASDRCLFRDCPWNARRRRTWYILPQNR